MNLRTSKLLVYPLFFMSGACGLVYQVVWSRMLTHVFGSTALAIGTVLAAFMAGLAIGSYWLGKRGDRIARPLRAFAACEVGIGIAALVLLPLLSHLAPVSVWITRSLHEAPVLLGAARLLLALLLLIVPTTLMGATLPFLSRHLIGRVDRAGHTLALLYGTNAMGAIVGALSAGFLLIGHLGTHHTVHLAVIVNVAIGGGAWWLARFSSPSPCSLADPSAQPSEAAVGEQAAPSPYQKRLQHLLMVCFALSGVSSLAYEVLWTRSLIFYVGNSTYALATMLGAFLLGIAAGSYLILGFINRLRRPILWFGWIQIGIGISAALAMPLLVHLMSLPRVQQSLHGAGAGMLSSHLWRFGLSFLVMLVPTVLIGMTFPLVGRIVLRSLAHTSADIGRVYAVNTLGNIVGALLPAFLLLPLLGIQKGVWAMALLNLAAGVLLLAHGKTRLQPIRLLPGAALLCVWMVLLIKPTDFRFPARGQTSADEVLHYREGAAATTMVYRNPDDGSLHMTVDGVKIGGSDPVVDYKQQWLAHLPKLLLEDYRSELSIGLGSGILAGESTLHASLDKITCVEIAPGVVEGAACFSEENHGVLQSERAEIVVGDGVNYLMASRERYDIISTDGKTQPEYSVNGTFFSREYYTLMKQRLTPRGLAIQWIALDYPPRILRCVIKTFSEVFPHVMLWQANGNVFLVGSCHELAIDLERIESRLGSDARSFAGIRKFGITSAESVVSHLVAREEVLRQALTDVRPNTLVTPIIEFYRPGDFSMTSDKREELNLRFLLAVRDLEAREGGWLMRLPGSVAAAHLAEGHYLLGALAILQGKTMPSIEEYFRKALLMSPRNESLRYQIFGHYFETAKHQLAAKQRRAAEEFLSAAVEIWPHHVRANWLLSQICLEKDQVARAAELLEAVVELDPRNLKAHRQLVTIHFRTGNVPRAIHHLQAILGQDPEDVDSLYRLGLLLGEQDQFVEALDLLQKAYRIAPENPRVIHCLAWIAYRSGDVEKAKEVVAKGGAYYKAAPEMERVRELILR